MIASNEIEAVIKNFLLEIQDGDHGTEADSLSSDSKTSLRCWSHTWQK
jgi:hypothetical protein